MDTTIVSLLPEPSKESNLDRTRVQPYLVPVVFDEEGDRMECKWRVLYVDTRRGFGQVKRKMVLGLVSVKGRDSATVGARLGWS